MRNLRVWLKNGYSTDKQEVCIPSKDKQKSTKGIFYWIEEDMQGEIHPNTSFPMYNLD